MHSIGSRSSEEIDCVEGSGENKEDGEKNGLRARNKHEEGRSVRSAQPSKLERKGDVKLTQWKMLVLVIPSSGVSHLPSHLPFLAPPALRMLLGLLLAFDQRGARRKK